MAWGPEAVTMYCTAIMDAALAARMRLSGGAGEPDRMDTESSVPRALTLRTGTHL